MIHGTWRDTDVLNTILELICQLRSFTQKKCKYNYCYRWLLALSDMLWHCFMVSPLPVWTGSIKPSLSPNLHVESYKFVKGFLAISFSLFLTSSWNFHDVCQCFIYNQGQISAWADKKTSFALEVSTLSWNIHVTAAVVFKCVCHTSVKKSPRFSFWVLFDFLLFIL